MRLAIWKAFLSFYMLHFLDIIGSSFGSECDQFGTCSQICRLVDHAAACSCMDGFTTTDYKSCTPTDPVWKLIFANSDGSVYQSTPDHATNLITSNPKGMALFVTGDVRNNVVYWTDSAYEAVYKTSVDDGERKPEVVVDTGISFPQGIAFDWITGNVYFTDFNLNFISVCAQNPTRCALIVNTKKHQPSGIALHPSEGIMFWTEFGTNTSIKRANMDGSMITTIVSSDIHDPTGITVDEGNSRIYWSNSPKHKIESSRFDGSFRQLITSSPFPFQIDILGDLVFWSDLSTGKIMVVDKFAAGNQTTLIPKNGSKGNLHGLCVMHPAKQPILRTNPCQDLNCSHICALAGSQANCLCPTGMLENGNTCFDDKKKGKLVVAQGSKILVMRQYTIGTNVFDEIPLPSKMTINALVYNPFTESFIISDTDSSRIVEYHIKTNTLQVLIKNVNVTAMDIDLVGENVFWIDNWKQTIEMLSLKTFATAVVRNNVKNAHEIYFDSELGKLYIMKVEKDEEEILQIPLDRISGDTQFLKLNGCDEPAHFVRSSGDAKKIMFLPFEVNSTKYLNAIYRVAMDKPMISVRSNISKGNGMNVMSISHQYPILGAVIIKNQAFWVDQTNVVDVATTDEDDNIIFTVLQTNFNLNSAGFPKVVAFMGGNMDYLDGHRKAHDCSPENCNRKICSHICLPVGDNVLGQCWCPSGFELGNDKITCIEEEKMDPDLEEGEDEKNKVGTTTTSGDELQSPMNENYTFLHSGLSPVILPNGNELVVGSTTTSSNGHASGNYNSDFTNLIITFIMMLKGGPLICNI